MITQHIRCLVDVNIIHIIIRRVMKSKIAQENRDEKKSERCAGVKTTTKLSNIFERYF